MLAAEGGQTETISRIAVINHESIVCVFTSVSLSNEERKQKKNAFSMFPIIFSRSVSRSVGSSGPEKLFSLMIVCCDCAMCVINCYCELWMFVAVCSVRTRMHQVTQVHHIIKYGRRAFLLVDINCIGIFFLFCKS